MGHAAFMYHVQQTRAQHRLCLTRVVAWLPGPCSAPSRATTACVHGSTWTSTPWQCLWRNNSVPPYNHLLQDPLQSSTFRPSIPAPALPLQYGQTSNLSTRYTRPYLAHKFAGDTHAHECSPVRHLHSSPDQNLTTLLYCPIHPTAPRTASRPPLHPSLESITRYQGT